METIETILLWLLGVVFLVSGGMKVVIPGPTLRSQPNMGWIEETGLFRARIAGFAEVAAAIVFVLTAFGVGLFVDNEWIAGLAAVGLVVVMALAAVTVHVPRDEPVVPNLALGGLAAVLAILLFVG